MALVNVRMAVNNQITTINSRRVSRIFDFGKFRQIWFGTTSNYSVLPVPMAVLDTFDSLQKSLGLVPVTEYNTKKRTIAVNGDLISRVEDGTSYSRQIWFGPGRMESTSSSVVSVTETVKELKQKIPQLVLVSVTGVNRNYAVNPDAVYQVTEGGPNRLIWFGGVYSTNIHTAVISVKETIPQLNKLGIV